MKSVIQRVKYANLSIDDKMVSSIDKGYLILLGVENEDTEADMKKLFDKIMNLRIFADEEGKMNLSVLDVKGEILLVSQFTLMADCKKGRRPSFVKAGNPEFANAMYEKCVAYVRDNFGVECQTGVFGADMQIQLLNDGPVTIILDSKEL